MTLSAYDLRLMEFGYVPPSVRIKRATKKTLSVLRTIGRGISATYNYVSPRAQRAYHYAAPRIKKAWEDGRPERQRIWAELKPELEQAGRDIKEATIELYKYAKPRIQTAYTQAEKDLQSYLNSRAKKRTALDEIRKKVRGLEFELKEEERTLRENLQSYSPKKTELVESIEKTRAEIRAMRKGYAPKKTASPSITIAEEEPLRDSPYTPVHIGWGPGYRTNLLDMIGQTRAKNTRLSSQTKQENKLENTLNDTDVETPKEIIPQINYSGVRENEKTIKGQRLIDVLNAYRISRENNSKPTLNPRDTFPTYTQILERIQQAPENSADWNTTKYLAYTNYLESGQTDEKRNWETAQEKLAKSYENIFKALRNFGERNKKLSKQNL